jgi:hypothetical protein
MRGRTDVQWLYKPGSWKASILLGLGVGLAIWVLTLVL